MEEVVSGKLLGACDTWDPCASELDSLAGVCGPRGGQLGALKASLRSWIAGDDGGGARFGLGLMERKR
jgi:hypothetical protein